MTRLVVIYDELKNKYRLVTGDSKVEVILKKSLWWGTKTGYSINLDKQLPISQNIELKIGPLASLIYRVDCREGVDKDISFDEKRLLDRIFNDGMQKVKGAIEELVSIIKIDRTMPNRDKLYLNRLIVFVYPEIIKTCGDILNKNLGQLEEVLRVEIDSNANLTPNIDEFVDTNNKDLREILKSVITSNLDSAYPPQLVVNSLNNKIELWNKLPEEISPKENDIFIARQLIQKYSNRFKNDYYINGRQTPDLLPE